MRTVPITASLLALAAPAISGNVWVVGNGPGQHPDLQDTIILAQDGDVVLVKAGTYESIRTTDRSMTVVAEVGANVQLQGAIRVIDLPSGRTATFSGLRASAVMDLAVPESNAGLYAKASGGQIVVQDCVFENGLPTSAPGGAYVVDCAGVSLVRVTARGSSNNLFNATPGMTVGSGASVVLHQVQAYGANGFSFFAQYFPMTTNPPDGFPGLPGIFCQAPVAGSSSFVFVCDTLAVGGKGGDAGWGASISTLCGFPGAGGDGILGLMPTNRQLVLLGFTGVGGASGWSCASGNPVGYPIHPGTPLTQLSGSPRVLSGASLVRDTALLSLGFAGAPGERVEIALSRKGTTFSYQPANSGVLHISNPNWSRVGIVPSSGVLTRSFKLPDLPLTDPGATYFVQARFLDLATGQVRLSNLHTVVEVDATY